MIRRTVRYCPHGSRRSHHHNPRGVNEHLPAEDDDDNHVHSVDDTSDSESEDNTMRCLSFLVASDEGVDSVPVLAHRAILASRSPVFKAMLENKMEESRSGIIRISEASTEALNVFVSYLYAAEASLNEQMACELLVLAEKYQVKHLKSYCEKFLISKLNWDNSVVNYSFAHQHNAKLLVDAALSLITNNMDKLTKQVEYRQLMEKDARLVVDIYEAYLSKQVNTAAPKDKG
ncbi:hypothetical protein MLD38_001941 [Melastoma candidum]|uniref:Uncharacterized protein n=1 Tax=Melastoma candidum TaxID=119954 RepID=A0ACB9SIT8_9MYRT|nr:hypothetical protein MLD38_001941 [Melastoma candidum]